MTLFARLMRIGLGICLFCCMAWVGSGYVWKGFHSIFQNRQTSSGRLAPVVEPREVTPLYSFHTRQNAFLGDFPGNGEPRTLKSALEKVETDIFGQLNFCLRQSDTVLSGPSRSKVLNEITNEVFKAIMIGFPPIVDEVLQRIDYYRNLTTHAPCVLDPNEKNPIKSKPTENITIIENCETDLIVAQTYITWLEDLLKRGNTKNSILLGGIYDRGYKRLLTLLKDAHCRFPADESIEFRPIPLDHNICLSLLDVQFTSTNTPSNKASNKEVKEHSNPSFLYHFPSTKTQVLNQISNIVVRCILYGSKKDRTSIANYIDNVYLSQFANNWMKGNMKSQEILYLKALVILLKDNLAAAEAAIAFNSDTILNEPSSFKPYQSRSPSNDDESIWNRELSDISDEEFLLYFEDSVVSNYPTTTTTTHTSTPVSSDSSTSSSTDVIEPTAFSNSKVYEYPEEEEQDDEDQIENLRLYDTYQNAFHRVVEVCLTEIGSQQSSVDDINLPQTDEFVQSFLTWEQALRRNLTVDLWNKNPEELSGTWELVNVGGRGSLNAIMIGSTETLFQTVDGVRYLSLLLCATLLTCVWLLFV